MSSSLNTAWNDAMSAVRELMAVHERYPVDCGAHQVGSAELPHGAEGGPCAVMEAARRLIVEMRIADGPFDR